MLPYPLQIADIDVIKYDIIDLVILYSDQYFILDNLKSLGDWVKVPYFLSQLLQAQAEYVSAFGARLTTVTSIDKT